MIMQAAARRLHIRCKFPTKYVYATEKYVSCYTSCALSCLSPPLRGPEQCCALWCGVVWCGMGAVEMEVGGGGWGGMGAVEMEVGGGGWGGME